MKISFEYLNHRKAVAMRTVEVETLEYLKEPGYGYEEGWFLTGVCLDRNERRSFALSNILPSYPRTNNNVQIRINLRDLPSIPLLP